MKTFRTPLRLSFAGGSTDLPSSLGIYNTGQVVSASLDLYTYCTIIPINTHLSGKKFLYCVLDKKVGLYQNISEIKNNIVRECFRFFNVPSCKIWVTSDIQSTGSGLASSSSITISVIKAINNFLGLRLSAEQIASFATKIEKLINPLVGYQDIYGCSIGGIKKIKFNTKGYARHSLIDATFLTKQFNFFLIPTNISRSSTRILETLDHSFTPQLLDLAEDCFQSIKTHDRTRFINNIKEGWALKQKTSNSILGCHKLSSKNDFFWKSEKILAHRLIGAGGGGYFLAITDSKIKLKNCKEINFSL